ncbi:MAG: hypothetical protein IT314_06105 [Anaerolineales bacterium]|nr:hypothetical protein [Anaerolineales bacterium]
MNVNWRWIVGIALILIALIVIPLIWQLLMPSAGGYAMMPGHGNGTPMMGGYGMTMLFGMWFMRLLPLGTLILIALGVVWLAKQLTTKPL